MKTYCTECQQEKEDKEFYKRFIKYDDDGGYFTKQGICTECLIKKFTRSYKLNGEIFEKTLKDMCKDYNLPFVASLVYSHTNFSFIERLKYYIKDITSLKQYYDMNYLDSIKKEEKSDIDFINEDIRELKIKISKSLQKEDFNAHGKWMNSLRDAIELRDQLQGKKNYTVNIGTITVNKDNAEDFLENLIKLAKENSSLLS